VQEKGVRQKAYRMRPGRPDNVIRVDPAALRVSPVREGRRRTGPRPGRIRLVFFTGLTSPNRYEGGRRLLQPSRALCLGGHRRLRRTPEAVTRSQARRLGPPLWTEGKRAASLSGVARAISPPCGGATSTERRAFSSTPLDSQAQKAPWWAGIRRRTEPRHSGIGSSFRHGTRRALPVSKDTGSTLGKREVGGGESFRGDEPDPKAWDRGWRTMKRRCAAPFLGMTTSPREAAIERLQSPGKERRLGSPQRNETGEGRRPPARTAANARHRSGNSAGFFFSAAGRGRCSGGEGRNILREWPSGFAAGLGDGRNRRIPQIGRNSRPHRLRVPSCGRGPRATKKKKKIALLQSKG